jgi:hypothetical protein
MEERAVPVPGPKYNDPMVRVKVLTPFYVAGRLCEPGITMSMLTSDAQAAAKIMIPPQVEIL